MWDLADWKDTVTYEDCDGSLLWQTADCQCRISAQKSFLGVSQSLSQRKGVNSYRKCFGDSFSEKTGVVWPFVSPSLWPCGSILTEHCIIFLALFSWMLKPCGVYCFLMFSLTGRVRMLQKWTEESLCIETESWNSSSWGTWALLQLMADPAELQWHIHLLNHLCQGCCTLCWKHVLFSLDSRIIDGGFKL